MTKRAKQGGEWDWGWEEGGEGREGRTYESDLPSRREAPPVSPSLWPSAALLFRSALDNVPIFKARSYSSALKRFLAPSSFSPTKPAPHLQPLFVAICTAIFFYPLAPAAPSPCSFPPFLSLFLSFFSLSLPFSLCFPFNLPPLPPPCLFLLFPLPSRPTLLFPLFLTSLRFCPLVSFRLFAFASRLVLIGLLSPEGGGVFVSLCLRSIVLVGPFIFLKFSVFLFPPSCSPPLCFLSFLCLSFPASLQISLPFFCHFVCSSCFFSAFFFDPPTSVCETAILCAPVISAFLFFLDLFLSLHTQHLHSSSSSAPLLCLLVLPHFIPFIPLFSHSTSQ